MLLHLSARYRLLRSQPHKQKSRKASLLSGPLFTHYYILFFQIDNRRQVIAITVQPHTSAMST